MRRKSVMWYSAAMAGLLGLLSLTAIGASKPDVWRHDFSDAAKVAKQSGRPLLIHFHATWCGPCRQMEKDVLHHSDVRDVLSRNYVAVMIDSDQHPELIEQFGIKSLPTDLVIAPDGVVLLKAEGGRDRKTYLAQMRHTPQQYAPQPQSPAAVQQPEEKIAQTQNSTPGTARVAEPAVEEPPRREDKPASQSQPANEGKLLVGLDRYSPVALAKHRQWRKGKTEFALVYQGVVYLLCDADEYSEFQTDPAKYAPRLLGCDPVVLWTSDRAVPGSTQYGAYFDGELFLFTSADNRDRFKTSPTLYTRPQHVLKIDNIDGPRWR
jgi:YHS domain-containing protein/thiol-disulfide isomerase/thioredoxin